MKKTKNMFFGIIAFGLMVTPVCIVNAEGITAPDGIPGLTTLKVNGENVTDCTYTEGSFVCKATVESIETPATIDATLDSEKYAFVDMS